MKILRSHFSALTARRLVTILAFTSAAIFAPRAPAQATGAVSVLRNLGGADGATPSAPAQIIKASDGNFYGVVSGGGVGDRGTVFKLTPGGQYSVLHAFQSQSEGILPKAIIQGRDGNLYGITRGGGANPTTPAGAGTFFRLGLDGTFAKLYEFDTGAANEGLFPSAIVQGSDGNFYGLTRDGGSPGNYGTYFRLSADGRTRTTLFAFASGDGPGKIPEAQLLVGSDGNFYGLSNSGGASGGDSGNGSIFQAKIDGTVTKIFTFLGGSTAPSGFLSALVQGADGALYGTSKQGGQRQFGTVFRATLAGSVTLLHEFEDPFVDGSAPGGLVQGSDGNFYGSVLEGFGTDPSSLRFGPGAFFQVKTDRTFTVVAKLDPTNATGPANPVGGLVEIGSHVFASLTGSGGTTGDGTLIKLTVTSAVTPRLVNVSTRARVETGDNIMIAGLVISGSAPKRVIIRAIGPSLSAQGVANVLADPQLTLIGNGAVVASNDDWMTPVSVQNGSTGATAAAIAATGLPPSDPRESVILVSLQPGVYTALVTGAGGSSGVALVEAYDLDDLAAGPKLINLSTRAKIQTGDNVEIVGFAVRGGSKNVLIRALGPSLGGVAGTLANPMLTLISAATGQPIATNDNWQDAANAGAISASGFAPTNANESAILMTLAEGNYTAIVSGVGNSIGVGSVEVYEVP